MSAPTSPPCSKADVAALFHMLAAQKVVTRRTYSKPDAALSLGVSVKTLERIINDGDLNLRLIRGKRVIAAAELDEYVKSLPYYAPAEEDAS